MGLFDMLSISASALSAERQRAEVTSANLANAETTHTDTGGPYVRKEVVFNARTARRFTRCSIAWPESRRRRRVGEADPGCGRSRRHR